MHYYTHNLNPVLLSMGPLQVRWYGLMYLVGFVCGFFMFRHRYLKKYFRMNPEESQILITYLMLGMMVGARLVYVLVYNPMYYWEHLSEVPAIWMGGLSFHGAMLGFIGAMLLYARHYKVGFFHISDSVGIGAALGIFFGRMGNFINGELYGRVTDVPWAIIFPMGGSHPRHPSQIYQGLLEGLANFAILLLLDRWERKRHLSVIEGKAGKPTEVRFARTGLVGVSFLIVYGIARFIVEFFREPDAQLGYFGQYFTMGQILCLLMIIGGGFLLRYVIRNPKTEAWTIDPKTGETHRVESKATG